MTTMNPDLQVIVGCKALDYFIIASCTFKIKSIIFIGNFDLERIASKMQQDKLTYCDVSEIQVTYLFTIAGFITKFSEYYHLICT